MSVPEYFLAAFGRPTLDYFIIKGVFYCKFCRLDKIWSKKNKIWSETFEPFIVS